MTTGNICFPGGLSKWQFRRFGLLRGCVAVLFRLVWV